VMQCNKLLKILIFFRYIIQHVILNREYRSSWQDEEELKCDPFFWPDWSDHCSDCYEDQKPDATMTPLEKQFVNIAMCECTLIQSFDDLKSAETLLFDGHYSQSVFLSSQSVEKTLKSLLSFFRDTFTSFFNLHSATMLVNRLDSCVIKSVETPYHRFHDCFKSLCSEFEAIGKDSWVCANPLSVRSRYFNFQTSLKSDSIHQYYVDSFPGLVYTRELATRAFEIAKEMFDMAEQVHEMNLNIEANGVWDENGVWVENGVWDENNLEDDSGMEMCDSGMGGAEN